MQDQLQPTTHSTLVPGHPHKRPTERAALSPSPPPTCTVHSTQYTRRSAQHSTPPPAVCRLSRIVCSLLTRPFRQYSHHHKHTRPPPPLLLVALPPGGVHRYYYCHYCHQTVTAAAACLSCYMPRCLIRSRRGGWGRLRDMVSHLVLRPP
jgi:hypothetical protein